MERIQIKRGLDLFPRSPVAETVTECPSPRIALMGADYLGSTLALAVEEGDRVNAGQVLATDRRRPTIRFVADAPGVVAAVHHGARRSVQAIVLEVDRTNVDSKSAGPGAIKADSSVRESDSSVRENMVATGLWTALRARPYERIPDPAAPCENLFITAIDTRPFAPSTGAVVSRHPDAYREGLERIAELGDRVFLCHAPDLDAPAPDLPDLHPVAFAGPHPAGLPGTHIAHLMPHANQAWHIDYQDVIALGYLYLTGQPYPFREIAVGGPSTTEQAMLRVRRGAALEAIARAAGADVRRSRLISGSLFEGLTDRTPYLGRYHSQVTIWPMREAPRFTWRDRLAALVTRGWTQISDAPQTGTGMLTVETFDDVWPLKSPAAATLRALLTRDTDQALSLGAGMLAEDDLALASFVCPAKQDYGAALRETLTAIERGD
jgi:Na+-transporting NADH:ubiquinone oxidoreductase subunit A